MHTPTPSGRAQGGALRVAHSLAITRIVDDQGQTATYTGLDAVSLEYADPSARADGTIVAPSYPPGCKVLLDRLMQLYYYDDQDLA